MITLESIKDMKFPKGNQFGVGTYADFVARYRLDLEEIKKELKAKELYIVNTAEVTVGMDSLFVIADNGDFGTIKVDKTKLILTTAGAGIQLPSGSVAQEVE